MADQSEEAKRAAELEKAEKEKAAAESKRAAAEAKRAAVTGYKVLAGKASLLIAKKRIKKGDRISAAELKLLPSKMQALFADELKPAVSLKDNGKEDDDE